MNNLYQTSIELLLKYQDSGGGFLASPNFSTYQYVWLRDGSFCAFALDLCGETQSADSFHKWVLSVLQKYRGKLENCIRHGENGSMPQASECLHSRFSVEGLEVPGNWGHHQLDGLGTWLWAYGQHLQKMKMTVPCINVPLLELIRDYLIALWRYPCSDCWEENENKISTHSLGAVYAGITAIAKLLSDEKSQECANEIQTFLFDKAVSGGHLVKTLDNNSDIDGSLLFLSVPYNVIQVNDARFQATLARIQKELTGLEGGVKRYAADTYYGGGEWILLSACLGWVACEAGDIELARRQVAWIESQASAKGELPEQVSNNLNKPEYLQVWIKRWGSIASPLLWSHAQYLILIHALQATQEKLQNP